MTANDIYQHIRSKHTMLCVGLDTDPAKLPAGVGVLDFNKAIIDATAPYCVAFKPNLAFYESMGSEGLRILEKTVDYLRANHPDQFLIADAKRGDIGNTARMYAKTYFETMDFDAVTLSPYMGRETVEPFLGHPGKFAIVVALSSNPSAADFQTVGEKPLYRRVMETMMEIGSPDEGGSAEEVIAHGANARGGLLINSSRGVLYASQGPDFAEAAAEAARRTARYDGC